VKNDQDRFGMPEENIFAARKWMDKKRKNKYPIHIYVPTRKEVATLPPDELKPILVGWMCHSPTEIIPSRTQIEEVRTALLCRNDADRLADLIKMCSHYISYS
jgi:hypothetical protein